MESVASMDQRDREVMSQGFGGEPVRCDAGTLTWCHRPRLYWCDWELIEGEGVSLADPLESPREMVLTGIQSFSDVVRSGWLKVDPQKSFPTFTTSRPRCTPGRKPAGIQHCSLSELGRWQKDMHRFPPYQYCESNCLVNRAQVFRLPDVSERELMLGFPLDFTRGCLPKNQQKGDIYLDIFGLPPYPPGQLLECPRGLLFADAAAASARDDQLADATTGAGSAQPGVMRDGAREARAIAP